MDKRVAWPALAALLMMTSGCTLFNVSDGSKQIKGIPFYSKVGKLKQTTVWSRTWLEVSFTLSDLDSAGKKSNTQSGFLQIDEKTASADDLNRGVAAAQQAAATTNLAGVINAFQTAARSRVIPASTIVAESSVEFQGNPVFLLQSLISNGTELVAEVDYGNRYFYNAQVPIFSSAETTIKLTADGSLSEVTSKADTTKLADVIPVAGLLSKAFGLSASTGGGTTTESLAPGTAGANRELIIIITRKGFVYTLTKLLDINEARKQVPLAFGKEDSIVRSALGEDAGKKDDKGKKATFEGSVNLPKDE